MLVLFAFVASASAASCDKQLAALKAADGPGLAAAYDALAACDTATAEGAFNDALTKAGDVDALVAFANVAIERDTWKPLWQALGKISDYSARDEVAERVGAACGERAKVVPFLQGAYFGLRDIEFQQWDDAYVACADQGLASWMQKQVASPPNKKFDEKFNVLMAIYVKKERANALPTLAEGAVKAVESGPYDAILFKMGETIQPDMGGSVSKEDQGKFEAAMIEVASHVSTDKARAVAAQLANNGSESAAAKLLPVLYGDRSSGGSFTYGAAAIEAGDCSGKKQAVLHYATITEPGTRWSIIKDIESPLRTESKAKLKGCTVEATWPVVHSPEPVKGNSGVEEWIDGVEKDWISKGYDVKAQKEKAITLP